jgi:hypothetical protein
METEPDSEGQYSDKYRVSILRELAVEKPGTLYPHYHKKMEVCIANNLGPEEVRKSYQGVMSVLLCGFLKSKEVKSSGYFLSWIYHNTVHERFLWNLHIQKLPHQHTYCIGGTNRVTEVSPSGPCAWKDSLHPKDYQM